MYESLMDESRMRNMERGEIAKKKREFDVVIKYIENHLEGKQLNCCCCCINCNCCVR